MTVYAAGNAKSLRIRPTITKTFNVMVWVEMDRVRIDRRFYTVTITGEKCALDTLSFTIDGKPATMEDVGTLRTWARQDGSFELVAEEVTA